MRCHIAGIGLRAPGLPGWLASRAVLTGAAAWEAGAVEAPPPAILPANERRRTGLPTRLALAVAVEAVQLSGVPADAVRGVFASGNGEGAILHDLLEVLADPGGPAEISPTQFHNSVHNAVAGYWAMGAQSQQPVTCIGAHDDTLAAALLQAAAEVAVSAEPVLCCVYDVPLPQPLRARQPTEAPFAAALVLLPAPAPGVLAELHVNWQPGREPPSGPPPLADAAPAWCEPLRRANPMAALLPLLAAVARGASAQVTLALLDATVTVLVQPCSTAPRS